MTVGTKVGTRSSGGYDLATTDFLTEARIRSAKPKDHPYKLRDGGGLFLLVTPANTRLWRLRYKVRGRESMLGLGSYPATSLKAARARRAVLRAALEAGKNPAAERRAEKESSANTFETLAREWLAHVCDRGCLTKAAFFLSIDGFPGLQQEGKRNSLSTPKFPTHRPRRVPLRQPPERRAAAISPETRRNLVS
jgi:hypothetical protein